MRRYWIPENFKQNDQVEFSGDIFHHIFDVCRQQVGFEFEVLTGNNLAYKVQVTNIEKKKAFAKIISERAIPPLPLPHIYLAISVPRFQVMDAIVEKSVELGVFQIHPFVSDFSFVRQLKDLKENKVDRWNKIVLSATQQSGRGEIMKISEAVTIDTMLSTYKNILPESKLGVFAYEGSASKNIKLLLSEQKSLESLNQIWIFVGSEGGFSETEIQKFKSINLDPITLGEQVLRVETACISLVSILKHELV